MSITPATAALPPLQDSTPRRYPELYEFCADLEARGRQKMDFAWIYGLLLGMVVIGAGMVAANTMRANASQDPAIWVLVLGVACISGYALYRRVYLAGFRMVIEAQRTLVLADTEHNTRRIAERMG